jgi:hypothetical protein
MGVQEATAVLFLLAFPAAGQTLWRPPAPSAVQPPKPPFRYLREDLSGTQPKLFVLDGRGATWNVKFGNEVHNEPFCWRIVQACGYFAEPSFYVADGRFEGYRPLRRATTSLQPDGRFASARFQYRDPRLKFLANSNWRWDRPPFAGTKELSGLKILIMLFSNWDNKDARVGRGGANTGEFALGRERIAAFMDWGSGMGRWGSTAGANTDWNCDDFSSQTPGFLKGIDQRGLVFGWEGVINEGFQSGIPLAHVEWLLTWLGKITDAELRDDLKAAGANNTEMECFTAALRSRIEQLRQAAKR